MWQFNKYSEGVGVRRSAEKKYLRQRLSVLAAIVVPSV